MRNNHQSIAATAKSEREFVSGARMKQCVNATGLVVVETAFQLFSALCCVMALKGEIPPSELDLAVYGMFSGAEEYARRIAATGLFHNVIYSDPYYGSEHAQGVRHMLSLLVQRKRVNAAFLRNCPELARNEYTLLVVPTATRLPVDVRQFACNASEVRTFLYEEGTSSRTGNIGRAFALFDDVFGEVNGSAYHAKDKVKLAAKTCIDRITHGQFRFNVTRYYFFNPTDEIKRLYKNVDVRPLDIRQLRSTGLLDEVYPNSQHSCLYRCGSVVLLTSARNAPQEVLDVEDRVIRAVLSISGVNVIIRPHPRSDEDYCKYGSTAAIDDNSCSWEVMCLSGVVGNSTVLIGSASSAQVNPHVLFGLEPYNVFLHRMVDAADVRHLETVYSEVCSSYEDRSRIIAPETIDDVVAYVENAVARLLGRYDDCQ